MPSRNRKILLTTLVAGATAAAAGTGVFAAFTATTDNTANSIAAGTVIIGDNDTGRSLYVVTNASPGNTTASCINVKYTGTLPSTVKLYKPTPVTNGSAFTITVERGTGATGFGNCTGFTPAATIYTGTLDNFPTTYTAGIDAKGTPWAQNDAVDYRFTVSAVDNTTPNARATQLASGTHSFTWEAHSN